MTEPVLPDLEPDELAAQARDTEAGDETQAAAGALASTPAAEADPADVVEQVREAAHDEASTQRPGTGVERGLEVDEADAWEGAAEVGLDDEDRR
jgi:hypothetical protein